MSLLYNFSIYIYNFIIRFSSLFNAKAKLWVAGRRDIFKKLQSEIPSNTNIAWFHCASLGEFEQGRTVIEAFRSNHPEFKILLTFFSPSGYEVRKNHEGANWVYYLPIDTPRNASKFIEIVNPAFTVFVKYEYWFNYMKALNKADIPLIVISAIFRPGQRFFSWYGGWQREMLKNVRHFFVQNESSLKLLQKIDIHQVSLSGDTRFDRVYQIAKQKKSFPLIEKFGVGKQVLLAGSTWPQDEDIIISYIKQQNPKIKFIFAPHEVHPHRIHSLIEKLPGHCLRFSEANDLNIQSANILVIDSIGILSHLYQYATFAYIGGGFGVGIHNILEAATFGNPVIFGPNYQKFQEAKDLIGLGGAFSIATEKEFLEIFEKLTTNGEFKQDVSRVSKQYVEDKIGSSKQIVEFISRELIKEKRVSQRK
jgi:3-deoxy-D-manno-octulosonic-acid transferase